MSAPVPVGRGPEPDPDEAAPPPDLDAGTDWNQAVFLAAFTAIWFGAAVVAAEDDNWGAAVCAAVVGLTQVAFLVRTVWNPVRVRGRWRSPPPAAGGGVRTDPSFRGWFRGWLRERVDWMWIFGVVAVVGVVQFVRENNWETAGQFAVAAVLLIGAAVWAGRDPARADGPSESKRT